MICSSGASAACFSENQEQLKDENNRLRVFNKEPSTSQITFPSPTSWADGKGLPALFQALFKVLQSMWKANCRSKWRKRQETGPFSNGKQLASVRDTGFVISHGVDPSSDTLNVTLSSISLEFLGRDCTRSFQEWELFKVSLPAQT